MENKAFLNLSSLTFMIFLSACTTMPTSKLADFNFSLNNTLSIFLLNNNKGDFFCIPVQYIGDYQINKFEFLNGNLLIGNFDIPLTRENTIISIHHYETDEALNQTDIFIEKYLTNEEKTSIVNEYNKGDIQSSISIWFDLIIDGLEQKDNGILDNFELVIGGTNTNLHELILLLPHFALFREKYMTNIR